MLARPNQRDEARAALLAVTDPRAVPSVARVFGTDRPADHQVAVGLLGQVESPQATRGLALLAVSSTSAEVRRSALETLRRRDPRDFLGLWIGLVRSPIRYEVQRLNGAGSRGILLIHGEHVNTQRLYSAMSLPGPLAHLPNADLIYDQDGLPVLAVTLNRWVDFSGMIKGSSAVDLMSGNSGPQPLSAVYEVTAADRARFQEKVATLTPGQPSRLAEAIGKVAPATSFSAASINSVFAGNDFNFGQMNTFGQADLPPARYTGFTATRDGGAREALDPNQFYEPVYGTQVRIPVGRMMVEAQTSAQVAQKKLDEDVAALDKANLALVRANDPVKIALKEVTGQDHGDDAAVWGRWWTDQRGYALAGTTPEVPTVVENVPTNYTPIAIPTVTTGLIGVNHSCFAAGTPVRTVAGTKPVEQVERGDLVLVQDTVSGALSYQPVLTPFHNPPSSTYRIKLGDDEVVATGIHRFWRAGEGWVMARDLKVGDALRVLGGLATVAAVEPARVQRVFNLEVAEGRSFFVGRVGALVHDNSPVEATPSPFDAAGVVTTATR